LTVSKYFSKLSKKSVKNLKIIFGHTLPYGTHKYFNRKPVYFTFLRSPEKRIISLYNYFATIYLDDSKHGRKLERYKDIFLVNNKMPTFEDWYKKMFKKPSQNIALLNSYQFLNMQGYSLEKFDFIGLTENFDQDSLYLYQQLGINKFFLSKNISKKTVKNINSDLRNLIKRDNKKAFDLYYQAKLINKNYNHNLEIMKFKRKLLLPFTQTMYDFPEYIHLSSAYLRTKSNIYSRGLDFLKDKLR